VERPKRVTLGDNRRALEFIFSGSWFPAPRAAFSCDRRRRAKTGAIPRAHAMRCPILLALRLLFSW